MKYIASRSEYEYNVGGFIIPKRQYSEYEMSLGKRAVLAVSDDEYERLTAESFFAARVGSGEFTVTDTAPIEGLSWNEKAEFYQDAAFEREKELAALKESAAVKDKKLAALQKKLAETQALLAERDKKILSLQKKK
jgi:hypothetical protein